MYQEAFEHLIRLPIVLRYGAAVQFVLFEFKKNWTWYSSRSCLIYRYSYESANDRIDFLPRYPLRREPFMKYPGN